MSDPIRHWKKGYSARTLAYCWLDCEGFPAEIKHVLESSTCHVFKNLEPVMIIPEFKVPLPPKGARPSQNDVFILAKSKNDDSTTVIMVEGKVNESFGPTIGQKIQKWGTEEHVMLQFLKRILNIEQIETSNLYSIYYQLVHRTASAILTALKFNSEKAIIIVHSFSKSNRWSEKFKEFAKILDFSGELNQMEPPRTIIDPDTNRQVALSIAWVSGNQKYLEY